ncbi:hypothetical protein Tco_0767036 [Tanacetum coccineum]
MVKREALKKKRIQKESVFKQGRKSAKGEPSVPIDPAFDAYDDLDNMETKANPEDGVSTDLHEGTNNDKEGTDFAKGEPSVPIDPDFDAYDDLDNMETKANPEDRVSTDLHEGTDFQKVSTDRPTEGTNNEKVSTVSTKLSTDEVEEGTDELYEHETKDNTTPEAHITTQTPTPTTPTPTPIIFGDDETIAQVLINISQAKEASREKEKGVELRDVENCFEENKELLQTQDLVRRDRLLAERISMLEEKRANIHLIRVKRFDENFAAIGSAEDEIKIKEINERASHPVVKEDDSAKIPANQHETEQSKKKRKGPDEDKEIDYEILDKKYPIIEWKSEYLTSKPQSEEEVYLNKVVRSNGQRRYFSTLMRGDLMIMFNPREEDEFWSTQQDWKVISWKLHSSSGVHTMMTDIGLIIHMLVESMYPLKREVLSLLLELKLEIEEDSTIALELIRFVKKQIQELDHSKLEGDEEDV